MHVTSVRFQSIAVASLLLLSGCAGRLFEKTALTSPKSPPDIYDCTRAQVRTLGYTERAHDDFDHRVVAERTDETVHKSNTQFRRMIDRLIVEIAPDAQGTASITVEAHSLAEYVTQRGQTFEEEKASDRVRQDAATLVAQCSQ